MWPDQSCIDQPIICGVVQEKSASCEFVERDKRAIMAMSYGALVLCVLNPCGWRSVRGFLLGAWHWKLRGEHFLRTKFEF